MSRITVPYIFDHHNHFSYYLLLSRCPSIEKASTTAQVLELLSRLPADRLSIVTGWHSDRVALVSSDLADAPPVIVINYCLHGFVASRKGEELLAKHGLSGSASSTVESEKMMAKLLAFFGTSQTLDPQELETAAAKAILDLKNLGLYGCEDMLQLLPLERWEDKYDFILRGWQAGEDTKRLKLFADGALGARTASLAQGFVGDGEPVLSYSPEQLAELLASAQANHAQVAVHAIGELAIEQLLTAYEQLTGQLPLLRLEHCQFITQVQAYRAKELGVVLSMQPNFSPDSAMYADRLSPAQRRANNPLRMLIDRVGFVPGQDLLFGSDGMPSGLAYAVESALFAPYLEQRLTLEELLAGYSADSQYGSLDLEIDYGNGHVLQVNPR